MTNRGYFLGGLWIVAGAGFAVAAGENVTGEPAIVQAAYWADVPGVAAAIAAHADVNVTNAAGATALLYGVQSPDIERQLLEHGANPNLAAAAQRDSYATVKRLLEHGADVHAKLKDWEAALPAAIYGGDARTIRMLLDAGMPWDAPTG